MPKKFAVATSSGVIFLKKVVREKVKLVIPMLTAVFILAGGGKVFTEAQIVALAAQPAINVTVSAGNQNDGKMYSDNWKLDANNDWEYYENGKVVKNAWVHDHGQWYLVGDDGKMRTGLYESYGKYYLLDDVRGTGTYGKLLKNGGTYKGVSISADTSSDYEGALSEDTLNRLSAVGVTKDKAVGVSGTQHAGQTTPTAAKDSNPFNLANYAESASGTDDRFYFLNSSKPSIAYSRDGKQMVVGIYEKGEYYAIGTNGEKYKVSEHSSTGKDRYWKSANEILASDWAKYVGTNKPAPDGRIYSYFNENNYRGIEALSSTMLDGTYRRIGDIDLNTGEDIATNTSLPYVVYFE